METITLEVGESPRVRVRSVGSDLRIVGRSGGGLEAQAPSRGDLTVTREAEAVVVSSRVGCLLFLPAGAVVEVGAVGGDARLSGMSGAASLDTVGGDLNLRGMGAVRLGRVAGDVRLVQAGGLLSAEWIGGDAHLESLQAELELGMVEGSLFLRHQRGGVRAKAHGDVHAELALPAGSRSRLHTSGDLICRLPPDASVSIDYRSGGDARVALPLQARVAKTSGAATLGAGEANLDLESGGDLRLELMGGGTSGLNEAWRQDLEARIEAEVEAALSEFERSQRLPGIMRADIAERIRSSMGRARRRAHRLGRAADGGRVPEVRVSVGDPTGEAAGEIGDEERLAILRMVESGTLTVEQAEQLFRAMGGSA